LRRFGETWEAGGFAFSVERVELLREDGDFFFRFLEAIEERLAA